MKYKVSLLECYSLFNNLVVKAVLFFGGNILHLNLGYLLGLRADWMKISAHTFSCLICKDLFSSLRAFTWPSTLASISSLYTSLLEFRCFILSFHLVFMLNHLIFQHTFRSIICFFQELAMGQEIRDISRLGNNFIFWINFRDFCLIDLPRVIQVKNGVYFMA